VRIIVIVEGPARRGRVDLQILQIIIDDLAVGEADLGKDPPADLNRLVNSALATGIFIVFRPIVRSICRRLGHYFGSSERRLVAMGRHMCHNSRRTPMRTRNRPRLALATFVAATIAFGIAAPAPAQIGVGITIPNAAISTLTDPDQALRYARDRIRAHDLPGAIIALQRYIMNYPDESQVVRFLGDLYFSSGDLSDAEQVYDRLVRDYPLDRDTHYQLGRLFTVENRINDAIGQFQQSLPDVRAIFYLVDLHQRKGDLAIFRQQLQDDALQHLNDVNAQLNAAQLFGALYMPRDAGMEFERVLRLDPRSQYALEGLGMAQTAEGAYDAAARTLEQCLQIDAKNYGCLVAEGTLDVEARHYDDAEAVLTRAQSLMPEEPDATFWLGRLADERGDWKKATAYYEQSIYVWPYSPDPYVQLAYEDETHNLQDQAEDVVQRGLHAADDARLHYLLGYIYRAQGKNAPALQQFLLAEKSLSPEVAELAKASAEDLRNHLP
jgi:tetratricopeptide (TPR) repeat protein